VTKNINFVATPGPSGSSTLLSTSSTMLTHCVTRDNIVDSVFIEVKEDLVQQCQEALATHAKESGTPLPTLVESLVIEQQKEADMVHCPEVLDVHSDHSNESSPEIIKRDGNDGEIILGMSNDEYASDHYSLGANSPKVSSKV
jgi:hypothetical protein